MCVPSTRDYSYSRVCGIRVIASRFKPAKKIRIKGLIKGLNQYKITPI